MDIGKPLYTSFIYVYKEWPSSSPRDGAVVPLGDEKDGRGWKETFDSVST